MVFEIGNRITRREGRNIVGGTIAQVYHINNFNFTYIYLINYDEGGSGWWPDAALMIEAL